MPWLLSLQPAGICYFSAARGVSFKQSGLMCLAPVGAIIGALHGSALVHVYNTNAFGRSKRLIF